MQETFSVQSLINGIAADPSVAGRRTAEVAATLGIHPNTLRWYEKAGLMAPVARATNGYRLYSSTNIIEAHIVYYATRVTWMSGPTRSAALELLEAVREGTIRHALVVSEALIDHIDREIVLARNALRFIEEWMSSETLEGGNEARRVATRLRSIRQAARETATTSDQIRNWERNGLLLLPRDRRNGYRVFGDEDLERITVIRFCRLAGYSITSIRRLLRAVDDAVPGEPLSLVTVADHPDPDERWYETFPTDTWLVTLQSNRDVLARIPTLLRLLQTLQ